MIFKKLIQNLKFKQNMALSISIILFVTFMFVLGLVMRYTLMDDIENLLNDDPFDLTEGSDVSDYID
jgi:predicted PurR-regulated permease PerM